MADEYWILEVLGSFYFSDPLRFWGDAGEHLIFRQEGFQ